MKVSPDDPDDLVLSTGKVVNANWSVIGLTRAGDLTWEEASDRFLFLSALFLIAAGVWR